MTLFELVRERQRTLQDRMVALEELRESGETTGHDPEYDRLCEEMWWLSAVARAAAVAFLVDLAERT